DAGNLSRSMRSTRPPSTARSSGTHRRRECAPRSAIEYNFGYPGRKQPSTDTVSSNTRLAAWRAVSIELVMRWTLPPYGSLLEAAARARQASRSEERRVGKE